MPAHDPRRLLQLCLLLASGLFILPAAQAGDTVNSANSGNSADSADAGNTAASVAVQTVPAQRGSLPLLVTAWGSAEPAAGQQQSLSVGAEVSVTRRLVEPGTPVKAGQLLLELRLTPAAVAAYQQAQSAVQLAEQQQAHTARLLAQQLATRDQLALADAALRDARSSLAALQAQHAVQPQIRLRAPADGVVVSVNVAPGEQQAAWAPLLVFSPASGSLIRVGVEPAQLARVRIGQPVELQALSDDSPARRGTVLRVAHAINPGSGLVDADIAANGAAGGSANGSVNGSAHGSPESTNSEVLLGSAWKAAITTGSASGWRVPRDAVLDDAAGPCLYQIAAGKARRVAVQRLASDADSSVVQGELDPALPVVSSGNYQLTEGMAVRTAAAPDQAAAPATATSAP